MDGQDVNSTSHALGARKPHELTRYFQYGHLPEHLQAVSRVFHATAHWVDQNLPAGPETTTALRKLLEAKDCAVRAKLDT